MDDLVKELRAFGANGYMLRAADEIERLRKERDEARRQLHDKEDADANNDEFRRTHR